MNRMNRMNRMKSENRSPCDKGTFCAISGVLYVISSYLFTLQCPGKIAVALVVSFCALLVPLPFVARGDVLTLEGR